MSAESVKILLTGLPGCGKTTAVMRIIERLNCEKVAGFYTQEIREDDTRKGFSWERLDGTTGILAHVDIKSPWWVSKYGVDVAGFEESVVPALEIENSDAELFVIDEIGKMECLSGKFVAAVKSLFASDKSVLVTVAKKGKGFIREIRNYPDVKLFNLTSGNREKIIAEVLQILRNIKTIGRGS